MHRDGLAMSADSRDLPRVLGFTDVFSLVVGNIIGSGIFIVPATIAAAVDSPVLLLAVWVVGGALSLFGALAFAELAAAWPDAGGIYVYLREAYGGLVAFLFGWTLFFVIESGAVAALAMAFSSKYLPHFVSLSPAGARATAVSLIAILVVINCVGVQWGALVQRVLAFFKVGAIVAVSMAVYLLAPGDVSHFVQPGAPPAGPGLFVSFGAGLVASLWAYKGWEEATFVAGEVRDPQRNLPLGLFTGTLLVVALYLMANLAYLYVSPVGVIATSDRVAADAMRAAVGAIGAGVISAVILGSITGATNGTLLTGPRVFFAMARDGVFFGSLARVHRRFLTPHVAIVATGAWSAVLCYTGTFEQLLSYVVFGLWLFLGLTAGAVFILRRKRPDVPRPYRTWGYPVTPAIFIAASLYIAISSLATQFWNSAAGLGLIVLGVPAYWYWARHGAAERRARQGTP